MLYIEHMQYIILFHSYPRKQILMAHVLWGGAWTRFILVNFKVIKISGHFSEAKRI